ncbi:5735_t:CDS:2 [Funneliformis caledonium]|uniref:5735_t:CDS:1 n=1 Tax=Funneliformis caledonium TaxID=1117310 RepID=A0A9N9IQF1_9GLOM|nr:5735_t:CDS:2 [Funneliformis caledonium]
MTYKRREAQFLETSNQKYHKSDEEHSDEIYLRNTEVTREEAFDKNGKIALDDSISVLCEEVLSDNYSKKKDNKDHEDDEPPKD